MGLLIFCILLIGIVGALLTPGNKCGCYEESLYNCDMCKDYTCKKCKRSGYDKI